MAGPDLLPCPFCGGAAAFSLGKTGDGKDWHYLECSDCEAMGPRVQYAGHNIAVKDALAEAWNSRAPTPLAAALAVPEVQALVEALQVIADDASVPVHTWRNGINFKKMYEGWRKIATTRIDIARAALAGKDGAP